MTEKKPSVLFRIIKWFVKLFYPKIQVEGGENILGKRTAGTKAARS